MTRGKQQSGKDRSSMAVGNETGLDVDVGLWDLRSLEGTVECMAGTARGVGWGPVVPDSPREVEVTGAGTMLFKSSDDGARVSAVKRDPPPACRTCRFYIERGEVCNGGKLHAVLKPTRGEYARRPRAIHADVERRDPLGCGPEGKWWEPKRKK